MLTSAIKTIVNNSYYESFLHRFHHEKYKNDKI